MGIFQSKTNSDLPPQERISTVKQLVDDVAIKYILTMNFESLARLNEKEYCDKLVILTSNIIEQNFTPLEITYLVQKTSYGQVIDKMTSDKMLFFDPEEVRELDAGIPLNKTRMCNGIAKFYIQIAHIYAAIIKTINPMYMYNKDGETIKVPLSEKELIPPDVTPTITTFNICDAQVDSLTRDGEYDNLDELISTNSTLTVHPTVCDFNADKTLMDEPGIPELMDLYKEDDYDFVTGEFKKMSPETEAEYLADLLTFYNAFTGVDAKELPSDIKTFRDIKLSRYQDSPNCTGPEKMLDQSIKGSVTLPLFMEYAKNIKNMMENIKKNQEILLDIINELFMFHFNAITGKREIKINSNLKESDIPRIIVETRKAIITLYLTCENDYMNGIKIYEAIVEHKIMDSAMRQIKYFKKNLDSFIDESI